MPSNSVLKTILKGFENEIFVVNAVHFSKCHRNRVQQAREA